MDAALGAYLPTAIKDHMAHYRIYEHHTCFPSCTVYYHCQTRLALKTSDHGCSPSDARKYMLSLIPLQTPFANDALLIGALGILACKKEGLIQNNNLVRSGSRFGSAATPSRATRSTSRGSWYR